MGEEQTQEPTAGLDLTDPTGEAPPTDSDDEWNPSENLDLTYDNCGRSAILAFCDQQNSRRSDPVVPSADVGVDRLL